jgi:hypothetical protein
MFVPMSAISLPVLETCGTAAIVDHVASAVIPADAKVRRLLSTWERNRHETQLQPFRDLSTEIAGENGWR